MKGKDVVHSTGKDDWETPNNLFSYFDTICGGFHIDAAAHKFNAKCANFFSEELSALDRDWDVFGYDTNVWLNPPYSQNNEFIQKAYEQSSKVNAVYCLLPVRTCTHWWHKYVMKADTVFLIRGRVKFVNAMHGAPFPSCVVVFTGVTLENPHFVSIDVLEFDDMDKLHHEH